MLSKEAAARLRKTSVIARHAPKRKFNMVEPDRVHYVSKHRTCNKTCALLSIMCLAGGSPQWSLIVGFLDCKSQMQLAMTCKSVFVPMAPIVVRQFHQQFQGVRPGGVLHSECRTMELHVASVDWVFASGGRSQLPSQLVTSTTGVRLKRIQMPFIGGRVCRCIVNSAADTFYLAIDDSSSEATVFSRLSTVQTAFVYAPVDTGVQLWFPHPPIVQKITSIT